MEPELRLESWPFSTTGSSGRTCLDAEDVRLDSPSSGTDYNSTQLNSNVGQWSWALRLTDQGYPEGSYRGDKHHNFYVFSK